MDRVRRTLCFATKTIALSAFCLTSSLVNAQSATAPQTLIQSDSPTRILQVVATGQKIHAGLIRVFGIATPQNTSGSGLLGSIFGVSETPATKTSTKTTKSPSSVPMPPALKKGAVISEVKAPSNRPTTQESKPDWSGVPYHAPVRAAATQAGSVPLRDPDPAADSSKSSRKVVPPTVTVSGSKIPTPPTTAPTAVVVPEQIRKVPRSPVATSSVKTMEDTSSRRSSRRTAASLAGSVNPSQKPGRTPTKAEPRPPLEQVADLVPRVTRKPASPASDQTNKNLPAASEAISDPPSTLESKTDELQPLPPANLAPDSPDASQGAAETSKPVSPEEKTKTIEASAASHRPISPESEPTAAPESKPAPESEPETGESLPSTPMPEPSVSENQTAPVPANEETPAVEAKPTDKEMPSDIVEDVSLNDGRLSASAEPIAGSNDLRGQPLTITGGSAGTADSESMQLSPAKTPASESESPEEDSSNEMRSHETGAGEITGTTSELPGIRVTTRGPDSILIRQDAEYEIFIENRGKIDTDGVLIRALVPEWADLRGQVASRGEIANVQEGNANRLVWKIGTLPAGATESMKLRLTASRSGNYDLDVDWTLVPQKSVARVQVREPRLNLTIEGPEEVVFGESQTYKVRVLNPGNGTASNVSFTLSPNSATPQTQSIGDIPPGKEAQFDIELTAKDHGDLKIHGLAAGALALRAEAEKTIKVAAAKLEAVLSGPQVKYQNTEGLYSLQVQNHGDASSDQIRASLRLPSGVKYLGGIEGAIQEENILRWDLDRLAPGAVRTYQFQCNMDSTGEHLFTFDCRGTAAGAAAVSISTRVESIADLVLTVSDPVAPAPIGTDVPYEIKIRNRGSKEATDVRVIAQFSHGVEPHRIEGQSGEVMTGQVLFDAIPRIAAGEEVRLRVIAQADRPGHHRFRTEIRSGDTVLVAEEATHYMSPEGERVSRRSSERLRR